MKEKIDNNIPNIDELQDWYLNVLREEALNSLEYEEDEKIEEQGLFFKTLKI